MIGAPIMVYMRAVLGGAIAALMSVVVLAAPASATTSVTGPYHEATSASDTATQKSVTATCPGGEILYGFGGRINPGNVQVALVGIMPSIDHTSVIVHGIAVKGAPTWSITAVAFCGPGTPPQRVTAVSQNGYVNAQCPDGTILYNSGFRYIPLAPGHYVDRVVPTATYIHVRASAAGPLFAAAYCYEPQMRRERTLASSGSDRRPSKSAVAGKPYPILDQGSAVYGGGVEAIGAAAFITQLSPNATLDEITGRMTRVGQSSFGLARMASDDDSEWETVVYGTCIGSWY